MKKSYSIELLKYELYRKRRERDFVTRDSKIFQLLTSEIEDIEGALRKLEE